MKSVGRPLAFTCPGSNLVVLTGLMVNDLPPGRLFEIGCEVQCPCGRVHILPASDGIKRRNGSLIPFEHRSATRRPRSK
jgi:hypothetical protein